MSFPRRITPENDKFSLILRTRLLLKQQIVQRENAPEAQQVNHIQLVSCLNVRYWRENIICTMGHISQLFPAKLNQSVETWQLIEFNKIIIPYLKWDLI